VWSVATLSDDTITTYLNTAISSTSPLIKREHGRSGMNFLWMHYTTGYSLVDPSPTNIQDMFIANSSYYNSLMDWLNGDTDVEPTALTPYDLTLSYGYMLDNAVLSDTVVLHPASFKILFGPHADASLQGNFVAVRSSTKTMTDSQIEAAIVTAVRDYFDIDDWKFGQTFYLTKLLTYIHTELATQIDSIVLVPTYSSSSFGDLFQILAASNEIFVPNITTSIVSLVDSYNSQVLNQ